jgi:capsular exopolysaccharide synthesis family protein
MDPLRYAHAFQRRWYVVVACVAVAVIAAWVTTETVAPAGPGVVTYTATADLLATGGTTGTSSNLNAVTTIASTRPVAQITAAELGGGETVDSVRGRVSITPDVDSGFVYVTAFSDRAIDAERTAAAHAAALSTYLVRLAAPAIQDRIDLIDDEIVKARRDGDEVLLAELHTAKQQAEADMAGLSSGLIPIGRPVAEQQVAGGFQPPRSRLSRVGIAALIGLLAGLALILLLERFDTRIRSRETAEERFELPVLTEIPAMDRSIRKGVATAEAPTSSVADAFRLLGAGVGVAAEPRIDAEGRVSRGRVVLVTSPGPGEGKTTTVANLAAALAEEGSLIVVISADLRRPQLHHRMGSDPAPGLTEAAAADGPVHLNDYLHYTRVGRVLMAPTGRSTSHPGEVLGSHAIRDLIAQARRKADWILIDTSPLLAASESAMLLGEADLVLVVVMAGRTSTALAVRTRETLEQLEVREARVVLNGSKDLAMPSGYRRYYRSGVPAKSSAKAGAHAHTRG